MVGIGRLIPIRIGDIEIMVEVAPIAGTEATSGRTTRANVVAAFNRAQDAIVEIARSTTEIVDRAGETAPLDRLEVEFGLRFSASGEVIIAGVASEATLRVTLGYGRVFRSAATPSAATPPETDPTEASAPQP